MLYNPKWDNHENFVRWLGEQPPTKSYCYTDIGHCALAQYFDAIGQSRWIGPDFERSLGVHDILIEGPHTFGAAYRRATGTDTVWGRIKAWWDR